MATLKIGFVLNDDGLVAAWYAETIKAVVEKGHSVYFVWREEKKEKKKKSFLFDAFERFENRWFRPVHDAVQAASIAHWLTDQNSIRLTDDFISSTAVQKINAWNLDLFYTVSGNEQEWVTFSEMAAYGLWRVHFGDRQYAGKNLPAFWEVMDQSPVTGSCLLVYKAGKTMVAYDGTTRTVPYSVKNNFHSLAWKASSYLPLRLETLKAERQAFLERLPAVKFDTKQKLPGNGQMLFLFVRNVARYLGYKRKIKRQQPFTLLFSFAAFDPHTLTKNHFTSLPLPGKDVFYADPFLVEKDGVAHVFFEEMNYAKNKAHISHFSIDQNKRLSTQKVVLEKPCHLSYPFVFAHNNQYYMIPETAAAKTVELYRADPFPDKWEFVMCLMTGVEMLDATVHFEAGKWWLFAAGANHPAASTNDQLFLFYSHDLLSTNWIPHQQNPVATHAANCRPAGRIFRHHGKLYRPAQNNASPQYGYGLVLNEIEHLTDSDYREKEVLSITPEKFGLQACHHLDFTSSLIVIDGIK